MTTFNKQFNKIVKARTKYWEEYKKQRKLLGKIRRAKSSEKVVRLGKKLKRQLNITSNASYTKGVMEEKLEEVR